MFSGKAISVSMTARYHWNFEPKPRLKRSCVARRRVEDWSQRKLSDRVLSGTLAGRYNEQASIRSGQAAAWTASWVASEISRRCLAWSDKRPCDIALARMCPLSLVSSVDNCHEQYPGKLSHMYVTFC